MQVFLKSVALTTKANSQSENPFRVIYNYRTTKMLKKAR